MKKRIVFLIQQMGCGGVEKSLLNFLNLIDKQKYQCDIFTILNEGDFISMIPYGVEVKEYQCPRYVKMMTKSLEKPNFSEEKRIMKKLIWKWLYYLNRLTIKIFEKNIIFKIIFKRYHNQNLILGYDAVIDFHGYGAFTTYLAAHADENAVKVSWIHEQNIYRAYRCIDSCYNKFDHIFGCSMECCENFLKTFPRMKERVSVLYNYLNIKDICNKASLFQPEILSSTDEFKIVSVGRVEEQKAFDRVIDAASYLKEYGHKFVWIVVGDGHQLNKLRERVKMELLTKMVFFVGYQDNPYPYINSADLYVQTSIAEGFCTTISEAIVLGKAVVTTEVSGVYEQLDTNKGGIIVNHSAKNIADAIDKLIKDKQMLKEMSDYNREKNMDYSKEIIKLLDLI